MNRRRPPSRAFALIEAVLSMVVISVMLVASLQTVAASRQAQANNADRLRALSLAQDLMAEIQDQDYEDKNPVGRLFGPEATELLPGRSSFNDVDDYNGLSESPPRDRSGTAIAGLTNWTRTVSVAFVRVADPTQTSVSETGVKRITVVVSRNSVPLVQLVALRTSVVAR